MILFYNKEGWKMLQVPLIVFLARGIPEGILAFYAIYVFAGKERNWKRIICSGFFLGLITYLIRFLPINFGVHTILVLLTYASITIKFHDINIIRAVTFCIIYIVIMFVAEAVSYPVAASLAGISIADISKDPNMIVLYGSASLLLTLVIVIVVDIIKKKVVSKRK